MIIIITPEEDFEEEIHCLDILFKNELAVLHLRKPNKNYKEHCDYLNKIDNKYHNRIVVHHFHELINEFNLKGIHFTEQKRKDHIDNPGRYFKGLSMFGKTISSSFHELEELVGCYFEFDYHFLSPVFSSISKQGYKGRNFDVNHIDKYIIGLGGVTFDNISELKKLGFKGAAILGGIWNSSTPVEYFKEMNKRDGFKK